MIQRSKKVQEAIALGGCGRSGTSILGKVLATARQTEYVYDPPMLHHAFFSPTMDDVSLKHMVEVYLYDECLLEQSIGRKVNLREGDMTYIGMMQSNADLNEKWQLAGDRITAENVVRDRRIIFKVTDLWARHDVAFALFPSWSFLYIFRDPAAVIASLHKKSWYSDASLRIGADGTSPMTFHRQVGNMWVPGWVSEDDIDTFLNMKEWDRYGMYYLAANSAIQQRDVTLVHYADLIHEPKETVGRLFENCNLKMTDMTQKVLDTIAPQQKHTPNVHVSQGVFNECQAIYQKLCQKNS